MEWKFQTMIVPANFVVLAKELCSQLAGEAGRDMFTTGLSSSGNLPETHFISSGMIENTFAELLINPSAISVLATQVGIQLSEVDAYNLISSCDVSAEDPFVAMKRLNLRLIVSTE